MTVKIKVNRKTHNIEKIVGDIGHTAQNMAGAKLYRHEVEPTFSYKFRRFIRRFRREMNYQLDAICGHVVGSEQAASVPYIGIEAHNERW